MFPEFCEPVQQINGTQGGGSLEPPSTTRWSEAQVTTWTWDWRPLGEWGGEVLWTEPLSCGIYLEIVSELR